MLELVIGMVISSLVITMVYVIYDNLSRQVVVYADQQDDLMAYNQFQNLFSKDVQLSKSIDIDDDKHIVLEVFNKEVHYFFKTEKIIRKAEAIDTTAERNYNFLVRNYNKEYAIKSMLNTYGTRVVVK